ncbi:Nucleoside-diphosphate-sugar epimerase [Neofusicoccum parvum]|uniref:Nucleoside-diphosphate-sugar epimerase n=1 Tax=Neofusicoccum parvum TaxID=310453 RepID=A0ACB5SLN1_9PEZI|nr:Nucleoside-diphosphate-sugar epimerase [Neofusicoccum parvum]
MLIHAELGQKAHFRGNKYTYDSIEDVSYPPAMADLTVWVATQENTKNEAFNSVIAKVPDEEEMSFQVNPEEWAKDKKPVWQAVVKKGDGERNGL